MAESVSSSLSAFGTGMAVVKPTTLPRSLLRFPPSSLPATVPPPSDHPTLAHPFTIPTDIYNGLLSPSVPITIALVYASVVTFVNAVNKERKYKPWAFSQTGIFKILVIVHNIILAAYSAWTCVGMINALVLSFAGWRGDYGLAGVADSLCKIHGPRGMGSAATYNETSSAWGMTNRAFHLAADGLGPEGTDVGRIWNEGLAFYGWLFYLSKFYEVIDTAIILAKGKKSSFLQTYHHGGAMLSMWAGIRYMSPPIWMFVLVNSGIHAVMYTFYLCTAIGIQVPKRLKQSLTTLQITQFIVGASYAFAHLFIAYKVPVSVPYLYHLGSAISSVASEVKSDASSVATSLVATASAGAGAWLKKAALRAAGREGLAENVRNDRGQTFGIDASNIVSDLSSREETRFRDQLQWTHCLDTSGQVFAILLNCMYLAPLTWLFVRFFITAYLKRIERRRSSTASEKAQAARASLQDASKGFARKVSEIVDETHGIADEAVVDGKPVDDGERERSALEASRIVGRQLAEDGIKKAKELKEAIEGADPLASFQKKSAETWQKLTQPPKDLEGESASGSRPDATEPAEATETSDAADAKSESESKFNEKRGAESVPSPNDAGTGVEEATGAQHAPSKQADAKKSHEDQQPTSPAKSADFEHVEKPQETEEQQSRSAGESNESDEQESQERDTKIESESAPAASKESAQKDESEAEHQPDKEETANATGQEDGATSENAAKGDEDAKAEEDAEEMSFIQSEKKSPEVSEESRGTKLGAGTEDSTKSSDAPVIHVDEDARSGEEEDNGLSTDAGSKSKIPSEKSKTSQSPETRDEDEEDKENQPPTAADPTGQTEVMDETTQDANATEDGENKQNEPPPKTSSNTDETENEDTQASTAANTEIEPLRSDSARAEDQNKQEAGEGNAKVNGDTSIAEAVKE